jgi:hypothetical protein
MKIAALVISHLLAFSLISQNNIKSLEIVRSNSFLSTVYPVKLIINDTLIKVKNNETMIVNYVKLESLYKSGLFCKRRQILIKEGELIKVKHGFFFPFVFDHVQVISREKFNVLSKKTKRKREITLKYHS